MSLLNPKKLWLASLIVLGVAPLVVAQQKPKVFLSDDFFLDSSPPAYLWFYDQKGILDKPHKLDGSAIEIVKAFAKNCECTVLNEPDDANYVVMISHHDLVFGPKLAEKKFVVVRVEGENLVMKASVRRTSNIVSDACKAKTGRTRPHKASWTNSFRQNSPTSLSPSPTEGNQALEDKTCNLPTLWPSRFCAEATAESHPAFVTNIADLRIVDHCVGRT